jgi:hypothetical protein
VVVGAFLLAFEWAAGLGVCAVVGLDATGGGGGDERGDTLMT